MAFHKTSILLSLMLLFSVIAVSSATTVTGVASVTLNQTHLLVYKGTTTYVNYNVTLYNGTAGNTTMGVTALAPTTQLIQNGINIGFTASSGVPPFSGRLIIVIAANATPGNYTAGIETGGADNGRHGFPTLFITISSAPKPTTSVTTTVPPTNTSKVTSTAPTTVATTVPPSTTVAPTPPPISTSISSLYYLIIAIVVIVIVAILVYVGVRHYKKW